MRVLIILILCVGLVTACEKKEPNEQRSPAAVQTQGQVVPEVVNQAEVEPIQEQKVTDAELKAEVDADWREIESAIYKLSQEDIETLELEGWVKGIRRHNALKKLSDKEIQLLQIEVRQGE